MTLSGTGLTKTFVFVAVRVSNGGVLVLCDSLSALLLLQKFRFSVVTFM